MYQKHWCNRERGDILVNKCTKADWIIFDLTANYVWAFCLSEYRDDGTTVSHRGFNSEEWNIAFGTNIK